jgi:hypothetical protein
MHGQVVEEQAGQNSIEKSVRNRDLEGHPLIEPQL